MFKKIINAITNSLRIKDYKIIGNIYDLEKKINGEIPVTRLELLVLVSTWGRNGIFYTNIKEDKVFIKEKDKGKSFDLSKLDTSKITDMSSIFRHSNFNGDISNWNTSNVTDMSYMFCGAEKFNQVVNFNTSKVTNMEWMFYNAEIFNQPLNFNTSKVTNMELMFYNAIEFNQPINFDISNIITMERMFCDADAFLDKYNSGKALPDYTHKIKDWINNNRDRMNEIDLKDKYGDEIDDFFSNIKLKIIKSRY